MVFWRMVFRNLSRRKSRNVLTIVAIMLGVGLFVGINIATTSALKEFSHYLTSFWGEIDIYIQSTNQTYFNDGNVTLVKNNFPEVETAVPRLAVLARIDNSSSKQAGIVGIDALNDFEFKNFNISGSSAIQDSKVVIGSNILKNYGVNINDNLNLTIPSSWNQSFSFSVIGIYYPPPQQESIDIFLDLTRAQNISNSKGKVSLILVKLKDSSKAIEMRNSLQQALGSMFEVVAPKAEAQERITGMLSGFQLGLNIMIMVSLLVCGFLVFNTMYMAVNERLYEIGVLRAIGGSRRQIFLTFFGESFVMGLTGSIIGVFIGFVFSRLFGMLFEQTFGVLKIESFVLTPSTMVFGFASGFVTVILGALYPAISAGRTNVIQAIRPEMRAGRRRIPDKIVFIFGFGLFLWGALFALRLLPFGIVYVDIFFIPIGFIIFSAILLKKFAYVFEGFVSFASKSIGKLVSRSFRRKLLRNAVSFGIIGISITFIVLIGGMQAGVVQAMEGGIKEAMGADIILIPNQTRWIPRNFATNLTNDMPEEVDAVAAVNFVVRPLTTELSSKENNASVEVLVIDPSAFKKIINIEFADSYSASEVFDTLAGSNESLILSKSMADKLHVSSGDNITVQTPKGSKVFIIAGVFTGATLQYFTLGTRPLSESVLISFESEKQYFRGTESALAFLVGLKNDYKDKTADVAQAIYEKYPEYGFKERSITLQDLLSMVKTQIDRVFSIIFFVLYFAVLIAALGVAITMIMNVTERKREIGLLRSQGMSRNQILSLFLTEALFMGFLGFLVALPCGLIMLKGATTSTGIMGFELPFIIPWDVIAQSLVFALAAAVLGSLYPAYRASRLNITRALQQR